MWKFELNTIYMKGKHRHRLTITVQATQIGCNTRYSVQ